VNEEEAMNLAVRQHQAGQLVEAEGMYRQVLNQNPSYAPAIHMLGVLLSQRGQRDAGAEQVRRAIALQPNMAEFYINLARIELERADPQAAASAARGALALKPDHPRALNHLGNALKLAGQVEESLDCFRRALNAQPDFVPAMRSLADGYRRLGDNGQADHWLQRALAVRPDDADALGAMAEELLRQKKFAEAGEAFTRLLARHPEAWGAYNGLGQVFLETGRMPEAVAALEKAVALSPQNPIPLANLGHAYSMMLRIDDAIGALGKAIELNPTDAEALNKLAYAYIRGGQLDAAIDPLNQAAALQPDAPGIYSNLGNVYGGQLQIDKAFEAYDRALYFRPDHVETRWNRALLLLLSGDFARGWVEHEWRWMKFVAEKRKLNKPLWDGRDIAGQTILLHAEQGYGDCLQFVRFAKDVSARGAKIVLECQPALVKLMQSAAGVGQVVAREEPLPAFDTHCPLLSLPYALNINSPQSIAPMAAYLSPPDEARLRWAQRMAPFVETMKVGIVWAGAPAHARDYERSIAAELLAPLADVQGVQFFSLQKSDTAIAKPLGMQLIDFTQQFHDFSQTAGMIAQLDLVIAADTSVAHLAGAMGKPTWTLLTYYPDWRWMLDRDDSPWYPTMRLFRQPKARDWAAVIGRVVHELEILTEQRCMP
jgi:tetratricopeptide (TPR) repeat protein